MLTVVALLAACAAPPTVISEDMQRIEGPLPIDFSGSWQRNYARDDEVSSVLHQAYNSLSRSTVDDPRGGFKTIPPSRKDVDSIVALARLAEEITRPDVITIVQSDQEISIEREEDFSIFCAFYDGIAKATETPYGTEVCGWDYDQLVSNLILPDGLQVTHRFTMSPDGQQLRVITTIFSPTSRVPFSLRRFYAKFERPPSTLNCIETLSMKRVCSTSEIRR